MYKEAILQSKDATNWLGLLDAKEKAELIESWFGKPKKELCGYTRPVKGKCVC
jgi:hypothetical protein